LTAGKTAEEGKKMTEAEKKERVAFIAKLLQRLGNEDWTKWLEDEKKAIDSYKLAPNETATVNREVFYEQLCKEISHEAFRQ
jgi:hypothetical protein